MDTSDMVEEVLGRIDYVIAQQEVLIQGKRSAMSSNGMDAQGDYYRQQAIARAENVIAGLRCARTHIREVFGDA